MTVERRLVVGLGDIKAITLACKGQDCAGRVTMSPDKIKPRAVQRCPVCSAPWLEDEPTEMMTPQSFFIRFLEAIGPIRQMQNQSSIGCTVLLEFEEPPR